MKDKYSEQWERLGDSDPYWAVLTDPTKKGNEGKKWNSIEFFQTGETAIERVFSKLKEFDTAISFDVALDFGCGVGRLSRALAKKFENVIAVDVSSSMLKEARKANHHVGNINFVHNTSENLTVIPSNSIDFVYSNIVLQHMQRSTQITFIREFCRVLGSGGILVFQTPSKYNLKTWMGWLFMLLGNKIVNLAYKIKYGMEMHIIAKQSVVKILCQEGMNIIRIERNDSSGSSFESYMYYVRKS